MSTHYRSADDVPNEVIAARLDELATAVTQRGEAMERELTMRVPAELDRDADLVMTEAAKRLRALAEKAGAEPVALPADLAAALAELHSAMGSPATVGEVGDSRYLGVVKLAAKRQAERPVALPDDWVAVPRRWTRNMLDAFYRFCPNTNALYVHSAIAAAIAAAPEVPRG